GRRDFRHRLWPVAHPGGICASARRPARLSLWRLADHGHGALHSAGAGGTWAGGVGRNAEAKYAAGLTRHSVDGQTNMTDSPTLPELIDMQIRTSGPMS